MSDFAFDLAHLLAGLMVVASMVLLYQDRLSAVINVFAAHAMLLGAAVGWQAELQGAGHLWITAAIAFVFKGVVIPARAACHGAPARHSSRGRDGGRVGPTLIAGLALTALSVLVVMPATENAQPAVARRPGVRPGGRAARPSDDDHAAQRHHPDHRLHVAGERADPRCHRRQGHAAGGGGVGGVLDPDRLQVFGVFVFRIRERFDTVDIGALERFRGEQQDGA